MDTASPQGPAGRLETLPLAVIRTDGGTQIRTSIYPERIGEYAQAMADGAYFPPVTVFFDGTDYWLADGFHRVAAYDCLREALNLDSIDVECEVIPGTLRHAIIHACGANDSHGIQRTNEDKRNAVRTILNNPLVAFDEDGNPWNDRAVGRMCRVDHKVVSRQRPTPKPDDTGAQPQYGKRAFIHPKTGRPTVMNTANIGARPAAEVVPPPVEYISEWDWLAAELRRIDEAIEALPSPEVVAARLPPGLAGDMPLTRALEIQRWWLEFTRLWAARDPEIQRFNQQQIEFFQEERHVKAR